MAYDEPPMSRYCLGCWYVLDGLTAHRCPECGRTFDPARPRTYSSLPETEWWAIRGFIVIGGCTLLNCAGAGIAFETIGEVVSGLLVVLTCVALVASTCAFLLKLRRTAIGIVLLVALLIVPYQAYLAVRGSFLKWEADSLIVHLEAQRKILGEFPANITGYQFGNANNARHFTYQRHDSRMGYTLWWWIGTPTASHWYSTPPGEWGYYPD